MTSAGEISVEVGMDSKQYEEGSKKIIESNSKLDESWKKSQEAAHGAAKATEEVTKSQSESSKCAKGNKDAQDDLNTTMINLSSGLYVAEKGYDMLNKVYNQFIGTTMAQVQGLESLQRQTGMTWQETQRWKEVTEDLGVDMGYLTYSMRNFSINMQQATVATSGEAKTFKELGVSVKNANGTLRDTNDVFIDTLSALQKMPNETQRNQVAMQLYGRSWYELSKLMEGNVDIRKRLADADPVMTEAEKNQVKAATQAFRDWNNSIERLSTTIGVRLIPMFTALLIFLNDKVFPVIIGTLDRVEYLGYKLAHMGEKISFKEYVAGRDLYREQQLAADATRDAQDELNDSIAEGNRLKEEGRKKDDAWLTDFINKSKGLSPEGEALVPSEAGKGVQKQATDIRTLLLELRVGLKENEDIMASHLKSAREKLVLAYKDLHGISYKQFTEQMKLINDAELAGMQAQTTELASLMAHLKDKTKANKDYAADIRNLQREAAEYETYIFATKNQKLITMWNRLKKDIEAGKIEALIKITEEYQKVKGVETGGGWPAGGITQFGPMGWEGSEMASFFQTAMKVFTDQGIAMTQEIYNAILQAWGTGQLIPGQRLENQGPYEEWGNTKQPVQVNTSGETTVTVTGADVKGQGWKFTGQIEVFDSKDTVVTGTDLVANLSKGADVHTAGDVNIPDVKSLFATNVTVTGGKVYDTMPPANETDIVGKIWEGINSILEDVRKTGEKQEELFGNVTYAATGSDAHEGKPYIVGEEGPELIIPKTSGTILNATDTEKELIRGNILDMFEREQERNTTFYDIIVGGLGIVKNKLEELVTKTEDVKPVRGNILDMFEKRQTGGPAQEGEPYVVGETGPELFVPTEDGKVVPFTANNSNWLYVAEGGGAGAWTAKLPEGYEELDAKNITEYWKKYADYLTALGVAPSTVLMRNMRSNETKTFSDTGAWKLTDFYRMDESVGVTGGGEYAQAGGIPGVYPQRFTNLWGETYTLDASKPADINNPLKGSRYDLSLRGGKDYTDWALLTLGFARPDIAAKYPKMRDVLYFGDDVLAGFQLHYPDIFGKERYVSALSEGIETYLPQFLQQLLFDADQAAKERSLANQSLGPLGIASMAAGWNIVNPGKPNPYVGGNPSTTSRLGGGGWDAATAAKLEEERKKHVFEMQYTPEELAKMAESGSGGTTVSVTTSAPTEPSYPEAYPGANEGYVLTTYEPRQFGGPVLAGKRYLVGENRPELFIPTSSTGTEHVSTHEMVNIYVELDGETIARKIAAPLVGEIRVRTGVKM